MLLLLTEATIDEKMNTYADCCLPMYYSVPQIIHGNYSHVSRHIIVNTGNKERESEILNEK